MRSSDEISPQLPFAMLMLTLVLAALDQTILSTAITVMARELPGDWPTAWVFSAYLLSATVVIALYGRLADVLGKKPMLLLALGLFLSGSFACGASQNMGQLVLARALQGAGGGGLMTLSMLTVADLFLPAERGRYQALLGAAYGVSTMCGPLVGGALVEHLSWHWAFWINVPPALLAWGGLALTLPPNRTQLQPPRMWYRGGAVDWIGAALLASALVSLLLGIQHATLKLPEQVSLWLLLSLGVTLTIAFLYRQHRAANPLVPLSLFSRPAYLAASFIGLVSGVALYCVVVFLPQYLQIGLSLQPTRSASHLLPLMLGVTLAAVTSGKLLRAQTPVVILARVGCSLMLASFALLVVVMHWLPQEPLALSSCLLPMGLGLGLLFPVITVVAQRVSPSEHMGIATAAPVMLRSLGGAAGVALLAELLRRSMKEELEPLRAAINTGSRQLSEVSASLAASKSAALAHGLQSLFGWVAVVVLLALLACRWLPQRQVQPAIAASVRAG